MSRGSAFWLVDFFYFKKLLLVTFPLWVPLARFASGLHTQVVCFLAVFLRCLLSLFFTTVFIVHWVLVWC